MSRQIKARLNIGCSVAFLFVVVYLFLHLEEQWEIAGLLISVPAVLFIFARNDGFTNLRQANLEQPRYGKFLFLLGAIALIFSLRNDHFALLMLATVLLYSTVSLGLTIQLGFAGLVNFAGIAFFGIGAYSMAVLNAHMPAVPDLIIILLGGVFSSIIGALLILPILRTRGHYAALITIAFCVLFRTFLEVNDVLGGPQGLKVVGLDIFGWSFDFNFPSAFGGGSFYVAYVVAAALLLLITFVITKLIESSWWGLNMDTVRLDEVASASFGIDAPKWKILAFMIGNFFAGLAGAVYGAMSGFIAPASFNFSDSLLLVSIVLLGGIGNAVSVLPAAFLVVVLPEKFQFIQEYRLLLFAIVVILILRFRPSGLMPRRLRHYTAKKTS